MKLVLDSGALIALERNDRAMWQRYNTARRAGTAMVSHGGVVGQAWRGRGPRQALLATALEGIEVRPLDKTLGRAAGELLSVARRSDVIDAAVVLLAEDEDHIVTSDPEDLDALVVASGRDVELIPA